MDTRSPVLAVTLGILLLVGGGCTSTTPTTTTTSTIPAKKVFTSADGQFTMEYPENWVEATKPGRLVQLFSPAEGAEDTFEENINVIKENHNQYTFTTKEFFDVSYKQLTEGIDSYQELDYTDTTVDGNPAQKILYTGTVPSPSQTAPLSLKFLQVLALKDKTSYLFTCTFKENSFDRFIESCNQMINSAKIK